MEYIELTVKTINYIKSKFICAPKHTVMSMCQFVDHFLVDIVSGKAHSLAQIPGLTLPSSGGTLLVNV